MSGDVAIVLAAGQGTRMRSTLPKVLHPIAGRPMLGLVLDSLGEAGFPAPTVVVGRDAQRVRDTIGDRARYVEQAEQRGTGDTARVGLDSLAPAVSRILVVHGDEPLLPSSVYSEMLDRQKADHAALVLLTTEVQDTRGFGRVVRNEAGQPIALVQEAELTRAQRQIREVNLGAYVFDAGFLRRYLSRLEPHPPKGELYLTDVVAMAARADYRVEAVSLPGGEAIMGINSLAHLERANRFVFDRKNLELMEGGVTIVDGASTFVEQDVEIAPDTVVRPFTVISGRSRIGQGCVIGPGSHIVSSQVGAGCTVLSSTLEEAVVEDGVRIGPYAHLRPGTWIGTRAEIGNYAEIKGSRIGSGTRMHHFGYVGDAEVGEDVNIGAGTVTCNFDGQEKHRTFVGDGAFIGSDTMLRAPVTVGARAATGAGSVVTHDVPAGVTVAGVPARELKRGDRQGEEG